MKKQTKDTAWPPLGVRDLTPDQSTKPVRVRFGSFADKLKAVTATRAETSPVVRTTTAPMDLDQLDELLKRCKEEKS